MSMPRNPLRLNLGFLVSANAGTNRDFLFDFPEVKLSDDLDLNGLSGKILVSRTPQGLFAQGQFSASIGLECVRCLEDYEQGLDWDFAELYAFKKDSVTESGLRMPEDGYIDFQDIAREYALLEIPISPICQPNCQGLCSICGENLNERDCGHTEEDSDSPFTTLKDLLD